MTPISITSIYIFISNPSSLLKPDQPFQAKSVPRINKRLLERRGGTSYVNCHDGTGGAMGRS